jgi:hypothetical protein
MRYDLAAIHPHLPAVIHGVHGLVGAPLGTGVVLAALAAAMWHHKHHWQRVTAWLFAAAAACFTVAIPPLFDALASLTATQSGMAGFLVVAAFVLIGFYLQAVRSHSQSRIGGLLKGRGKGAPGKPGSAVDVFSPVSRPNRHRRIGTPVTAIGAGAIVVVILGAWRLILKNAGTAVVTTLHDLTTHARQVNSGQAARAVPPGHVPGILIGAVIVVAVIALIMRAHDRRGKKGSGGGRPAIPGGVTR